MRTSQKETRTSQNQVQIESTIRAFLSDKAKSIESGSLGRDVGLFSTGLLDSLTFIQMVSFIEEEFSVLLADHLDVSFDTLDSIRDWTAAIQLCKSQ